MHIVNLPSPFSAVNSSSSINIVNKACKLWTTHEIGGARDNTSYFIKHPDGLLSLSTLVSTKLHASILVVCLHSNILLLHYGNMSKDMFWTSAFKQVILSLDVGRSSLSTFVGNIKNSGKLFMSLACLASRQESEKLVPEPSRQFISLSPMQNLWLGDPREIWFHDMVFNGAFYQH